jgi:hypothetical protein
VTTVLVSNDDLTVLGSPEIVELLVDIGPTGTRGSKVFVGIGNPNNPGVLVGQTVLLNDLYINTAPGVDYGYLYQYISQPGGSTWVQILKMNPTIFPYIHETTFTSGTAEIVIPISSITTQSSLTAEKFNIQYNISNSNPVSSSISLVEKVGTDLIITIKAVEYDSGWSDLSGTVTTYIFISIVL